MIRRVVFFKNCKPALTNAVKRVKPIDADEDRIAALEAEVEALEALVFGRQNARQYAYALAA